MLRVLYGGEELACPDRDAIGNYEAHHSPRRWDGSLYRPEVNDALCRRVPGWKDRVRWPEGKVFAVCLTHDVDSVRMNSRRELFRTIASHVRHAETLGERMRHGLSVAGLRHRPRDVDLMTPWIEAERRRGFRSTFFVFPTKVSRRHPRDCTYTWDDPTWYRGSRCRVREMLRGVVAQGWEVGLHGSLHSALDEALLREQKEDLEACLGQVVGSTRQHNLRFDLRRTPEVQASAGFQTDSTLGFNGDVGFRNGIAYPFRLRDPAGGSPRGPLEIPLVLHDWALLHPEALGLGEEAAFRVCCRLIDAVTATKGVVTLLWHPNWFPVEPWFRLYERLLDYLVEKKGWGATAREIHDWWTGQGLEGELERGLKEVSREQ